MHYIYHNIEIVRDVDKAYATYKRTKSKIAKEKYLKLAAAYNQMYGGELYNLKVR